MSTAAVVGQLQNELRQVGKDGCKQHTEECISDTLSVRLVRDFNIS